jgi:hypothetical protein
MKSQINMHPSIPIIRYQTTPPSPHRPPTPKTSSPVSHSAKTTPPSANLLKPNLPPSTPPPPVSHTPTPSSILSAHSSNVYRQLLLNGRVQWDRRSRRSLCVLVDGGHGFSERVVCGAGLLGEGKLDCAVR